MSQIDDFFRTYFRVESYKVNPENHFQDIVSELESDSDLYNITDRSQIINPESLLQQVAIGTGANSRALYNKYLAILNNIKSQQEAAYQEYYNSPEQQVIRDKAAGLNPDILGVSGSQAAQAAVMNEGSPYDGLPTQEELDAQKSQVNTARIQSVVSMFGAVGQLASIPFTISSLISGKNLTDLQSGSQTLANLSSFEDLVSNEISSRLSDAIDSGIESGNGLDIAEWFGNDENFNNILETYRPDAGLMYDSSFANVRKRMQKNLAKAYENGKVTADNRYSFAALLADPRVSRDVVLQAAYMQPYVSSEIARSKAFNDFESVLYNWNKEFQLGKDVKTSIEEFNNIANYNADYYENLKAEVIAAAANFKATDDSIRYQFSSSVQQNLMDVYKRYPYDLNGYAAIYMSRADFGGTFGGLNALAGGLLAFNGTQLKDFLNDKLGDESFLSGLLESIKTSKLGEFLDNSYREYMDSFKNPDTAPLTD